MEPAATFNQEEMSGTCPFPCLSCPPLLEKQPTTSPHCTHHPFRRPPHLPSHLHKSLHQFGFGGIVLGFAFFLAGWILVGGNLRNEHAKIIEVMFTTTSDSNSRNIDRLSWFKLTCKKFKVVFEVLPWSFYLFPGVSNVISISAIWQFAWCILSFCWQQQSTPECRMFYSTPPTAEKYRILLEKTKYRSYDRLLKRTNYKRYEAWCRDFCGVQLMKMHLIQYRHESCKVWP